MNVFYEEAKRIALGLVMEQDNNTGSDLWNIPVDNNFRVTTEMPFQFFERGFEPMEDMIMQKIGLKIYIPEYDEDRLDAERRLEALKQALSASDLNAVKEQLNEVHPEEWLSLIFLDGIILKNELVPLLDNTSEECRQAVGKALDQALSRLVNYKDLLKSLRSRC